MDGEGVLQQGDAMCNLCNELNCQIEKCRKMAEESTDELMREALATLIISYEEDKTKLHLNPDDGNDDHNSAGTALGGAVMNPKKKSSR
jgi:hypothetical protein